jgi:2-amino-4-hydroxy-6-hydroxymethyldihydropteridine diphosphokinase
VSEAVALIALGSNIAHAGLSGAALLREAVAALAAAGYRVRGKSSVWETAAWPPSDQPAYANAVVACDVGGRDPAVIMADLLAIERRFGRTRRVRWEARTLDLDLIDLGGLVGDFGEVILPHPRVEDRAFVLAPLAELAPDWRHPVSGQSAQALLVALPPGQDARLVSPL